MLLQHRESWFRQSMLLIHQRFHQSCQHKILSASELAPDKHVADLELNAQCVINVKSISWQLNDKSTTTLQHDFNGDIFTMCCENLHIHLCINTEPIHICILHFNLCHCWTTINENSSMTNAFLNTYSTQFIIGLFLNL